MSSIVCATWRAPSRRPAAAARSTSPASIRATSRRRSSAWSRSPPAPTSPAAITNAIWNPSTSAAACWAPPASALAVRSLANVESTASPSAPPTCCEVLNTPEARPASALATFVVATRVSGTKVRPMPIASGARAASSAEIGAVDRGRRREDREPDRGQGRPHGEHPLRAQAADQLLREHRADHDPEAHRQERDPGLERRVAEHLLQVQGAEEEHREHPGEDQQHHAVGRCQRAQAEEVEPHQRRLRAAARCRRRRPAAPRRRRSARASRSSPSPSRST